MVDGEDDSDVLSTVVQPLSSPTFVGSPELLLRMGEGGVRNHRLPTPRDAVSTSRRSIRVVGGKGGFSSTMASMEECSFITYF